MSSFFDIKNKTKKPQDKINDLVVLILYIGNLDNVPRIFLMDTD